MLHHAPPELAGVTHREVLAGDIRLHVAEAGSGPPLLLLHGWPQHWWAWRHVIGPLSQRYRVLAVDLRGWGWSEAPAGNYAKSVFASDIIALLDQEGIGRARVIGHDWGGYTAFLLALEYPDRIERMVALDIVPPWPSPFTIHQLALPLFLIYQVLLASPAGVPIMTRLPGFVRALLRAGAGPDMQWSRSDLDLYADVLRDHRRARASSACYRTFLAREAPESLRGRYRPAQLTVPSLLLMGGASALNHITRPRPSANLRVEEIPRAGHFLAEEKPDEVLERALPFLAEHGHH